METFAKIVTGLKPLNAFTKKRARNISSIDFTYLQKTEFL